MLRLRTAALVRLRADWNSRVRVPDLTDTEGPVTESNCIGAIPAVKSNWQWATRNWVSGSARIARLVYSLRTFRNTGLSQPIGGCRLESRMRKICLSRLGGEGKRLAILLSSSATPRRHRTRVTRRRGREEIYGAIWTR